MKKIKLFPAPHVEVRIHVSDEMERDYVKCKNMMKHRKMPNCIRCSWKGVNFYGVSICALDDVNEKMGACELKEQLEVCDETDGKDR